MRRTLRITAAALLVLFLAAAAGWWWYTQPQPLLAEATASLASTPDVTFTERDGRLEWRPSGTPATTALVVYPGGKVPAPAYGPLARAIAGHGYLVIVVPMPFNLAVLDAGAADRAIAAHPGVARWALAGHSLGGSMAAQYAADHPGRIEGLALWASYPATDLSGATLAVVSVYGSFDAGADRMSGDETRAQLPPDTVFVPVEGGNHEQMGWYTGQPNDPPAAITRQDQQDRVAAATVAMLASLGAP